MATRGRNANGANASLLTWEQIQARAKNAIEPLEVEVKAWGGKVRIRGLTLDETRQVTEKANDQADSEASRNVLVALYTVQAGLVEPVIGDAEILELGETAAGPIFDLYNRIDFLTGGGEAVKAAEATFRGMGANP